MVNSGLITPKRYKGGLGDLQVLLTLLMINVISSSPRS